MKAVRPACLPMHPVPSPKQSWLPPSLSPAGAGNFIRLTEMAFFHKRSRTLLVTDALLSVTDKVGMPWLECALGPPHTDSG